MSLWRSRPGTLPALGTARIGAALVIGWLAPTLIGVPLLLTGHLGTSELVLGLVATAFVMTLAPAFTWSGMLILVPLTLLLLHRGWFGLGPAVLAGIVSMTTVDWDSGAFEPEMAVLFGSLTGLATQLSLRFLAAEKFFLSRHHR